MPNVVTHGLMALDVYNQLESSRVKSAIAKYPKAYLLGSNGPDILFYYNVFPWQDQKVNLKVADYGHAVHSTNINAFYNVGMRFVMDVKDEKRKEILLAYLAGHLMHWALDSLAHPFIFYRSGKLEGITRYHHYRYESMIDSLMVLYVKRRKLTQLHAKRFVNVDAEERRVIASFYQSMLANVYDIYENQDVIESAIVSLKNILGFLYDPHNITLPIIQGLEKQMASDWAFSSHVVGSKIDATYDVLNLKHETWSNPTDITDTSTQSFIDLYNESIDLGLKGIALMNDVMGGKESTFDSLLQGACYDSGRAEGIEMKYFDSIYLK